ncbi:CcmD family protein [Candidatus Contubernalis alkaliaceticus]|nr:CcmD family protein [Candidatus Contubernalis alkalaceticus]UNC92956.1 CcmD family protein [Candidatus Contubernalis alkalaceticus]
MSDLYVVMVVTLLSWIGIFLYLLKMDLKVRELEKK